MKRRYIWHGGRWVEWQGLSPRPRVAIIGDTIRPTKSMADGKVYDSRSRYCAEVKARGFEIVGNEKAAVMAPPERPRDDYRELYAAASQLGIAV